MKNLLYVLVWLFLLAAGAGLYFEIELNNKRTELTERNRMQENYIVKIASTVEKSAAAELDSPLEIKKDASPVEARLIDDVAYDNLLEDYEGKIESSNLETFKWDNSNDRKQLRSVYAIDPMTGKPEQDGAGFRTTGKGTEDEILNRLFEAAKAQQSRLNTTRQNLKDMRERLETAVAELNKLKPEARQDKVTIVERDEKITKLEGEKAELENTVTKKKAEIDELNVEVTSLKDDLQKAKDETETTKEDLEKEKKKSKQLEEIIKKMIEKSNGKTTTGGGAVTAIPFGDKGKIVKADNENGFVIVQFTDEALKEMRGNDPARPLPLYVLELGVKRPGFNGTSGEFVGRIRLRQEVKGTNLIICDILGAWTQKDAAGNNVAIADNDVIFAAD